MFNCGHCLTQFSDINSLILHLKKKCFFLPKFSSGIGYKCGQGCFEYFDSLNTLRMHLKRVHSSSTTSVLNTNAVISECLSQVPNSSTSTSSSAACTSAANKNNQSSSSGSGHTQSNILNEENHEVFSHDAFDNKQILMSKTALVISSFLADPIISRKTVQLFIKSLTSYVGDVIPLLLQNWYSQSWQNQACLQCKPNMDGLKLDITQSIQYLTTEYKWIKFFKDNGTFIEPEEYTTTTEPINEFNRRKRKNSLGTGQFIPLRFVLHNFLSIPGVLKSIDEYIAYCLNTKVIINVIHTSIWLNTIQSIGNNVRIFPIFVYYDDYETGNPLGSHAGVHKLGAVYASIACLPPNLASQLKYIFLLALFYSADRTRDEGNLNCFHKVIDELNFLSGTGIALNVPGYFQGRIKFRLVSLIGDNLGLHSILGFVENFTANYPCRFCRSHKTVIKTLCTEDLSTLRNENNYLSDLYLHNPSQTGIKEASLWRQVEGFDMFKQASVDIMHDILEGVARYTMKEVLKGLFSKRYLNLDQLNNRIALFNYGPDSNCKPPQLFFEKAGIVKWKMSAMETYNFIIYFPCFVSHKVPYEDQHWELYLLLRKLLDLTVTEAVYPEICDEIRDTVTHFNSLYISVSASHLKPKFHHLIHYPGIMEKLGPLHSLWSMRYEAKHRISKISARASSNRMNLPKTLAIKHQLQLNHIFLKNNIDSDVEHSTCKDLDDPLIFDILSNHLHLSHDSKLFSISYITLNGIRYQPKQILALDIDENSGEPNFIEVSDIYYTDNKEIFFKGLCLETNFFDPHVFAYCVKKSKVIKYISYESLAFLKPNNMTKLPPHGWWYVVTRNSFY